MPTYVGNGTPMRAPLTPPPTRMPPTSPSTRASSSQTSATSASWQRTTKNKKVQSRTTPKYTTSSDEGSSSDDEDDLFTLFANLNMQQKEKLNELIGAIHEKDELLDSREEFLIKENKKHVKVKNAYAQEVEKCENLTKELSMCHDSITNLRNENASLNAKIDN
jgi:wobble nucleotide-excising tRNase